MPYATCCIALYNSLLLCPVLRILCCCEASVGASSLWLYTVTSRSPSPPSPYFFAKYNVLTYASAYATFRSYSFYTAQYVRYTRFARCVCRRSRGQFIAELPCINSPMGIASDRVSKYALAVVHNIHPLPLSFSPFPTSSFFTLCE